VTHDRYLVDRLASQIWELRRDDDGLRMEVFDGPYREYLAAKTAKPVVEAVSQVSHGTNGMNGTNGTAAPARMSKNEQRRLAEAVAALEAEIGATEERLVTLSEAMQVAAEAMDYAELMRLTADYEAAGEHLAKLFEDWEQMPHEPASDSRTDG